MASNTSASTFQMESNDNSRSSSSNSRFQTLRRIPRSWLIAAAIFYVASVLTVGLMAGLIPKRTQYITIIASSSPAPSTSSPTSTSSMGTQTNTPSTSSSSSSTTSSSSTPSTTLEPSTCVEDECNPRLSSDIVVRSYELQYRYNDTQQTTVQGTVTIDFTLKQPVKQLIYHAKRMAQLDPPALFENDVNRLVNMNIYAPNDYVTLQLLNDGLFSPNQYKLVQNFVVNLDDSNVGFYQSIFQDEDGSTSKLLATKFEPIYARKAFPCFDEPHLKAVFKITLLHPQNTIAMANFPISEETTVDGLRQTKFDNTFRMSTYLAAWAILPSTYGRRADNDDEPMFTAWARREPTRKNQTVLALEIAMNSVSFFSTYFDTVEPVPPKIDLLAVPDFSTGAMENWGLVSFREDRLIFDENVVSIQQKQRLMETISHELSHFWFGNYVTCSWWTDLWLNEAMATWLSYKPFTANYPQWNLELQALTDDMILALWEDAKPSSHPIVVKNISNPAVITSLFDTITYSKGASILRMLEKTVGSDRFRDALQSYLKINAFDVGDPTAFYNALFTDISGEDFMKNWLEEANYPLVNVNLTVEGGNTKVGLSQSRFLLSDVLNSTGLNSTYRWKIPLKCVLGGNYPNADTSNVGGDTIELMFDEEQTSQVLTGKTYSWIKCNRDFQGFYVTRYAFDTTTYSRFSTVLEAQPTFFSAEDKTNFLEDTFLLAYRGLINYSEPLRLFSSLVKINTQEYVHWRTFQTHWEKLAQLLDFLPNTQPKFQNFVVTQILSGGRTLDSIVTVDPNDNPNTKLVKGTQYELLCRVNHSDSLQRASTLFRSIPRDYFNNSGVALNIAPDHLSTVYKYHLQNDDNEADWNMMYNYYQIAISPQEQTRALKAISSSNNRDRLVQLLNTGLSTDVTSIRKQDYFEMIQYMSEHPVGRDVVWTFYKENYQRLVSVFTLENRQLGAVIRYISRPFDQASFIDEMNQLFTQHPNAGSGVLARQQAIDQVKMNVEWIRSREINLREALDSI